MFGATHLQGLGGVIASGLHILVIVVVAWLAIVAAHRAIRGRRIRIASRLGDQESVQRAGTLGRVSRYLAAVVVSLVAGTLVPGELGVSVAPILGAGVLLVWRRASARRAW